MKRIILTIVCFLFLILSTIYSNTLDSALTQNESTKELNVKELNLKVGYLSDSLKAVTDNLKEIKSNKFPTLNALIPLFGSILLSVLITVLIGVFYVKTKLRDKIILDSTISIKEPTGRLNQAIHNSIKPDNNKVNYTSKGQQAFDKSQIIKEIIAQIEQQQRANQFNETKGVNQGVTSQQPVIEAVIEPQQKNELPKIFYCIAPLTGTNYFLADKTTPNFVQTESIFRFKLLSEFSAEFSVENDASTMKRAISFKNGLLNDACDSYTSSKDTHTIITEKAGIVKREGDKWIIIKKAQIKFQ